MCATDNNKNKYFCSIEPMGAHSRDYYIQIELKLHSRNTNSLVYIKFWQHKDMLFD